MQRIRSKIKYFLFFTLLMLGGGMCAAFIGFIEGEDFSYLVFAVTDFPILAVGWMIIFSIIPSPSETKRLLLPYFANLFKGFLCAVFFLLYFAFVWAFPFYPIGPWVGRTIVFVSLLSVFLVYELCSKRARARDEAEERVKRVLDAIRTQDGVTLEELAKKFETTEIEIEMSIWKMQEKGVRISIERETGEVTYEG